MSPYRKQASHQTSMHLHQEADPASHYLLHICYRSCNHKIINHDNFFDTATDHSQPVLVLQDYKLFQLTGC